MKNKFNIFCEPERKYVLQALSYKQSQGAATDVPDGEYISSLYNILWYVLIYYTIYYKQSQGAATDVPDGEGNTSVHTAVSGNCKVSTKEKEVL